MDVACYARVSTGSEEQAQALEQQQARLDKRARDVPQCDRIHWYVDIASGSRDDRPELARLIADAAADRFGVVIVTRLDRLSRSSAHGATLLRFFQQDTTPNLIAIDDSLDLATPGGRFMARLLISWAEAESDRLGERTRHGHAHRRAQRKPFGSRPPFGYRFTEARDNLEHDPVDGPIAAALLRRFLEVPIVGQLMTYSHQHHGHAWSTHYSLRRWLSNPVHTGARCYGGQVQVVDPVTGQKRRRDRPPGQFAEVIPDCHPAFITPMEHARIMAIFHARSKRETAPLTPHRARTLSGLLVCASCGCRMNYHRSDTPSPLLRIRCQKAGCPERWKNSIREDVAEEHAAVLLAWWQRETAMKMSEDSAHRQPELPPEGVELVQQLQQLEAMNDPDVQNVIESKRRRLAEIRERVDTSWSLAADAAAIDAFISEENPDPARFRELLLACGLQMVVSGGKVVEGRRR